MRCNLIPAQDLTDQHLLAERNELRMIPPLLRKKYKKFLFKRDIPERYVLGTGHMNFWLDKFLYLENRYQKLVEELLRRNFNLDTSLILEVDLAKSVDCYHDWIPNNEDYLLIKERILQKILLKPQWYRYYGKRITPNWVREKYPLVDKFNSGGFLG